MLGELIDVHYKEHKQPHVYASLMNLSASYLNNLCKQMLGKTLSDLIQERVTLEAKRFFAYSHLTISQVSDKLHFSEPSYFIRFFKKQTGVTPEQFREQINRAI
jgi:AraC-like DNA-binding protein